MFALLVEVLAFVLSILLLTGCTVILVLEDHAPWLGVGNPPGTNHLSSNSTLMHNNIGSIANLTIPKVISLRDAPVIMITTLGQHSDNTKAETSGTCDQLGYHGVLAWVIVNSIAYTILLFFTMRGQYRRVRRAQRKLKRDWDLEAVERRLPRERVQAPPPHAAPPAAPPAAENGVNEIQMAQVQVRNDNQIQNGNQVRGNVNQVRDDHHQGHNDHHVGHNAEVPIYNAVQAHRVPGVLPVPVLARLIAEMERIWRQPAANPEMQDAQREAGARAFGLIWAEEVDAHRPLGPEAILNRAIARFARDQDEIREGVEREERRQLEDALERAIVEWQGGAAQLPEVPMDEVPHNREIDPAVMERARALVRGYSQAVEQEVQQQPHPQAPVENVAPRPAARGPTSKSKYFWFEIPILISHGLALGFTSGLAMVGPCRNSFPILAWGMVAVLITQWMQILVAFVLRPIGRRKTAQATSTHYETNAAGQAVAPHSVQIVVYVPRGSLPEWRHAQLPHPAHEIGDGASANPECAICYDEFTPPTEEMWSGGLRLRLWRRLRLRPGRSASRWIADPLWHLPCGHVFHEHCCAEWFSVSTGARNRCPYCNQDAQAVHDANAAATFRPPLRRPPPAIRVL